MDDTARDDRARDDTAMDDRARDDTAMDDTARHDPVTDEGRRVRVSYRSEGFGPALVVVPEVAADPGDGPDDDAGVLRVGLACVTLEIPRPDGGRSVLSWDPDEVGRDPRVA